MRAFLLTAAAVLACTSAVFAQFIDNEYSWEVGLNAGLCAHTRPLLSKKDGNSAEVYQGTRTKVVHDYSARVNYYFNDKWNIGLDIGERKWESWADWTLPVTFGQYQRPYEVSILIASHAITESVHLNYNIPFYTDYMTFNRANIYFGVMFGLVTTVNDGGQEYSRVTTPPDSGYTYVSSYHYGFGIGYNFGAQVGFTYYLIPKLGVNIELAARFADVGTNDMRYNHENSRFNLMYFPQSVGLRWRF